MRDRRPEVASQFLVFVSGGLLSAGVDIGLLQLLLTAGSGAVTATTIGFIAGLLVNYAFHARVTFGKATTLASSLRFGSVVALNYAVTLIAVQLSVGFWGTPLPGKIASLPVVALNGFLLSRYWVFRT